MAKRLQSLFFFCVMFAVSWASAEISKDSEKFISGVFSKYKKSSFLEFKVQKKVTSELMGTEKSFEGTVLVGSKKFRFESEAPDKALVVYDGKVLWNVQYPQEGSEGKVQAAKLALNKKSKSQIFLLDLLQERSILKDFVLSNEKKTETDLQVLAKPKVGGADLSEMTLSFDRKTKKLSEVTYTDDLGNKTLFKLIKQKSLKKIDAKKFQFKPGADVEVVDL